MAVDRKTGRKITVNVRRASVSVTGSIQPLSLALALGREHFENGLVARLLFCFPPRRQRHWTEAEIPEAIEQAIDNVFAGLFDLKFGMDENGDDIPSSFRWTIRQNKNGSIFITSMEPSRPFLRETLLPHGPNWKGTPPGWL
jgi:hypothetical protein